VNVYVVLDANVVVHVHDYVSDYVYDHIQVHDHV